MREGKVTITPTIVMKWNLRRCTLDGLLILLILNFLLLLVLINLLLIQSHLNVLDEIIPSFVGFEAYPSISKVAQETSMECGRPDQLSFNAREVSDGTLFKAIEDYDPDSKIQLYQLHK